MAKEGSVAPQERVNIRYTAHIGDAREEKELPLNMLMIGDYTLRQDDRMVEERKAININKDNFEEVMKAHDLKLEMTVPDKLTEGAGEDDQLNVNLKVQSMRDFEPEAIAEQVPELAKLLEMRKALTALKGPLANSAKFRKKIEQLLDDDDARQKMMDEIGMNESQEKSE